jgi:spermidine synthase
MSISKRGVFYVMVFFSGFAGLLYQILWMRQLGLLLGNTSHAAAITLGVFFLGLASGSWFWGNRCERLRGLLRTYAWLEIGIGICGIFFLLILNHFHDIYPIIYQAVGPGGNLLVLKCLLTWLMVFPASFLMGGTIPVLGQFLIRNRNTFGTTSAKIYGINTVGAALGAFLTGFYFIVLLGFKQTCFLGIFISMFIAAVSFFLARKPEPAPAEAPAKVPDEKENSSGKSFRRKKDIGETPIEKNPAASRSAIYALAFISGFNVLALEVLWTRMFAQVHENSVYSFSAVLIVVLISLAVGALLASWLAKRSAHPLKTLFFLMIFSGISVCISPSIFFSITDKLRMIATDMSFGSYVWNLFRTGFTAVGIPCFILGTVFPFLMKSEERFTDQPGKSIGILSAINTLGAIFGSLVCGFVMLRYLGMWRSVQMIAATYFLVALIMPLGKSALNGATKTLTAFMLVICFTILSPAKLPVTGTIPGAAPETLVEVWEASDNTVSVVKTDIGGHSIKINSSYSLGSSASAMSQIFQTRIPLLAYPKTGSVFYLGMGTGATAGEALNKEDFKNIHKVVVCELSPDVVTASKKYFTGKIDGIDHTHGLFNDPRARVLVEDGRNHLMATEEKFDMINADLFLPYQRGTGSLYSLEHFQSAKRHLNPGGVFVQWLPLYQVSEYEFGVITRTMLQAFDQVTLWRHNFQPGSEIVALVGHRNQSPLPACDLDVKNDKQQAVQGAEYTDIQNLFLPMNEQTILLFYCGNVSASRNLFESYPVNTDDRPVIEYKTPRSLHRKKSEGTPHFVAEKFSALVDQLLQATPPMTDPMLADRNLQNRNLPLAGASFHKAHIAWASHDRISWKQNWQDFLKYWVEPDVVSQE